MISPRIRTGFSFRSAVGKIGEVIGALEGQPYAPITDRASTFGFYRWQKAALAAGMKPVFGVELAVTDSINAKKPSYDHWTFIAKDNIGEINRLVEQATMQFRYQPLLTLEQALAAPVIRITGHRSHPAQLEALQSAPEAAQGLYYALGPSTPRAVARAVSAGQAAWAAVSDNRYPRPADQGYYELVCGRKAESQSYDQFIQTEEEWRASIAHLGIPPEQIEQAIRNSELICGQQTAQLLKAHLPEPERPDTIEAMCRAAAVGKGVNLSDPVYEARLRKEIDLISAKGYDDYFYIVADICQWARQRMMVGPARGSSCGSLVCYLLDITTIDPIPHGLIFERFIDINRDDMPDVDIDFSDQQRYMVFDYISKKYGRERVARLGTVAMYKARSVLSEGGAALGIPRWKLDKVADSLIERSSGDSRALDTLKDTLTEMESGREVSAEFPEIAAITRMEGHPRHSSQHAAGVVIASEPITDYVAIDHRSNAIMADKKDAEDGYGFLKVDVLGLTQLSIFEDALELAGLPRGHLETLPLDDQAAFDVLNKGQWSGIFQFNGLAMQSLTKQTKITCFEDIVNITALARPGPMTAGGASDWVYRKNGWDPRIPGPCSVTYPHPAFEPYLKETLGVVAFQEDVMNIGREIGDLSWDDVTQLRKAMSKSLGKEYFDQFGDRWKAGAAKKGIPEEVLVKVWDDLCAYGAWAMNKSHCVAYGTISYWCCWLKAHFPFEFAAATLNHVDTPEKQIAVLREIVAEGFDYVPIDPESSGAKWAVATLGSNRKRTLVGPLSMVKGIGPKLMQSIVGARARGEPLSDRAKKLLNNPKTPIDSLFPIRDRVKTILPDLTERQIYTTPTPAGEITEDHKTDTTFLVVGIARTINPRDENEPVMVARRGGKRIESGPTTSLNLQIEDDSGIIYCKVPRFKYERWGRQVVERGRPGKAIYAVKGTAMAGRRFLMVEMIRYIGDMEQDG